jgi:multidrug resistance efflux pump
MGAAVALAVAGGCALYHGWGRLFSDLQSPWLKLPGLPLALGLLTQTIVFVNLPRALSVGVACRRYGGRVRGFGFFFWNGLVPTFYCDIGDSLRKMSNRGRWTVLAVHLWVEVVVGALALLLWSAARHGSAWGVFWAWLVPPCVLGLIIHGMPFLEFGGYFLLSYAVDEINLRPRALAETNAWFAGRTAPEALTDRERYWFRYYGVCYYLFRLVFDPALLFFCGYWCTDHFHWGGGFAFVVGALWWYSDSIGRVIMDNETVQCLLRWGGYVLGSVAALSMATGWLPWVVRGGGSWWLRWPIRFVLLAAGLVALAVTPYNYEVCGECRILPGSQCGVRSQLSDEIVRMYVSEGGYVQPGDMIATLSGVEVRAQLAEAEAQLKHDEAELDLLVSGPLDEQVQMAADRVESAKAAYDHAQIELDRNRVMFGRGAISAADLDKYITSRDSAQEKLDSAREKLWKLKEGYRSERVRAAEALVKKDEEKVAYYKEQVKKTDIRTPIGGHVVLPYMEQRVGHHVNPGDLVTVVQDTTTLQVEIAADDVAALDLKEGMVVKVRLYGTWGRLLTGRVQRITLTSETDGKWGNMPVRTDKEMYQEQQVNSQTKNGSYHVRVYATLDEAPANLSPDMTGYARIIVDEDDQLWRSVARPLARFLRTEVWYWLP